MSFEQKRNTGTRSTAQSIDSRYGVLWNTWDRKKCSRL